MNAIAATSEDLSDETQTAKWKEITYTILSRGSGFLAGTDPTSSPSDNAMSYLYGYGDKAFDVIDWIVDMAFFVVLTSCGLAYLTVILLWVAMIYNYKSYIYLLRQGKVRS